MGSGRFGRDRIGSLKVRKAVGWQPTGVQDGLGGTGLDL